jgi:hypothetical protein
MLFERAGELLAGVAAVDRRKYIVNPAFGLDGAQRGTVKA